ncbi:sensor histidine kinase [Actinoplanes sp. NPDC049265]|uniref:sensor histidine kinase n=1 Tax=Actinoplanes sp. NPDC049265 TaxID=3363902 RepID=UPI00371F438C
MKWFRRRSLRARLTGVSVAALAAGLVAGGLALIAVLNFALLRSINQDALATARAVADLVEQNALSDPIPATVGVQVQVVDAEDRVRAVSATADRLTPILYPDELKSLPNGRGTVIAGDRIGVDGAVRVVVVDARQGAETVHVLVARSTADVTAGIRLLRITLLVVFPLLVLVLTVVSWQVVGAALNPVEALRSGAEEITGGARSDRLPVPDSRDEIHRLAVTLNDMLRRLDASRARQRAFVADAAHELRSPLTTMRTELEVAQRLPDDTDWPALSADLLTDVERLSRLVDDLLLLARADDAATRPAVRFVSVDLSEVLAGVVSRYPSVTSSLPPSVVVTGDPDSLSRVVANLLDNAVRHSASSVTLTLSPDAVITVTDDGPGIPAADRERVFGRFTRLDDARARDAGGSGLGLAIVRELLRQHHGTITLGDASPGLRVEVRLPKS